MTPRMEPAAEPQQNEVADFYNNQKVFVTGATGFLGKILVEKLLRSCPGIETIYILIRSKKDLSVMERTEQLLADQIFQKLDKASLAKVMPIDGDLSLSGLGISNEDREKLQSEVNVVFHSAATVRFNDPLKPTLITNLRGTADIVKLANEMRRLKSFVYVSTAFSHCIRSEVDEFIYELPTKPEQMLNWIEWMTEEQMEEMSKKVMGDYPNPYCFSKALAEIYVQKHCTAECTAIFRPSIVISCAIEPLPGWNDNLNGPVGITAGTAMGLIRTVNADLNAIVDITPVDMNVHGIIVAARDVALNQSKLKVFNFVSGARNPVVWNRFLRKTVKAGFTAPPSQALWYYCLFTIKSYRLHRLAAFFLHTIPAVMLDTVSLFLGKKRRMVKLYQKVDKQVEAPSWFLMRTWRFHDKNMETAYNRLSPADKERYHCDIAQLNWDEFAKDYWMGMRHYILKDDPSTIPAAIKRYRWMFLLHRMSQVMLVLGSLGLIHFATSAVSTLAVKSMKLDF